MKASWPMGFHPSGSFFNLDGLYGGFMGLAGGCMVALWGVGQTLQRTRNMTKKDGEYLGILGGPSIGHEIC